MPRLLRPVALGELAAGQALDLVRAALDGSGDALLPLPPEKRWPGLTVLSVSPLLAEVIQRIHSGVSVDTIFQQRNHPALG